MKYRSGLLHEVISNLSKNANGEIKFCCADSHRNSKIKFSDSKIISYDSIQLLRGEYWERELTLESQSNSLTMQETIQFNHEADKLLNEWNYNQEWIFKYICKFRLIFAFLAMLLTKLSAFLHFEGLLYLFMCFLFMLSCFRIQFSFFSFFEKLTV